MDPLSLVITAAVLVWIVHRQFAGRFVASGRGLVLPLVLIVLGLQQAGGVTWGAVAIAAVAGELLITAGLGVVRGFAVRLSIQDGYLFQRGGVPALVLWGVSIGVRILVEVFATGTAVGPAVSATLMLSFGVSLAAQGAVIAARAKADGRPIRPSGDRRPAERRSTLER